MVLRATSLVVRQAYMFFWSNGMSENANRLNAGSRTLIAGILAAIGASVCCVGPLVLLALGISGAWIANLTAMEPYRPLFIGLTLLFLGMTFQSLYWTPRTCRPGALCTNPRTFRRQRLIFWSVTIQLLGLIAVPWLAPLFY